MDIESETRRIQTFIDRGNYHAAMNLSISAMNDCRRNDDQAGVDYFLEIIKRIVDTMSAQFGSS
jgi:hypothetical protein